MHEALVQEIENVAVSLGSLKALLGISQIDDGEWEHVSLLLDDFSFRLRTSASEIRERMKEGIHGFGETHSREERSMCSEHGCGNL